MARPLHELQEAAEKALQAGFTDVIVNPAELKMLKDYELVVGTADQGVAVAVERFGYTVRFVVVEPGHK